MPVYFTKSTTSHCLMFKHLHASNLAKDVEWPDGLPFHSVLMDYRCGRFWYCGCCFLHFLCGVTIRMKKTGKTNCAQSTAVNLLFFKQQVAPLILFGRATTVACCDIPRIRNWLTCLVHTGSVRSVVLSAFGPFPDFETTKENGNTFRKKHSDFP